MTLNAGVMSSASVEWVTPQPLFDELHSEFNFTADMAADPRNAKLPVFYTKETNGLDALKWVGRPYCNPPWSDREMAEWLSLGMLATLTGDAELAVYIVPARTDTAWWHTYVMAAQEVRLIKGRVKFLPTDGVCTAKGKVKKCVGPCKGHPAPFPCAVVIFKAEPVGNLEADR